ncbi:MAG: hypothetical protein AB7O66_03965 [Limisphaerales bacterium]
MQLKHAIIRRLIPFAIPAALAPFACAAPLFEDNFDTDSSANWTVRAGYYEGSDPNDYTVDWAFDYSQLTVSVYKSAADAEPVQFTIPPAPNSAGTTRGVRVTINKGDDLAERMAVNLYPKGQSFSGNFTLKVDVFLAHGAYADTGVGTTEYAIAGINHGGEYMNWFALVGTALRDDFIASAVGKDNSDGIYFGFTGDGGAARDFVSIQGGGAGQPPIPLLADSTGGLIDRNSNGAIDVDDSEAHFNNVFPASRFEFPGFPSKRWVEVEVSQIGDTVTWKIDGHILARRVNDTAFKSGTIMLGYLDPFTSIADPREETYAIFDNVRVEPIRTVVVDTADNASGAGDGKTSLAEALAGLQENDIVTFNIPGNGPHVIATPVGGYPLITRQGVTIDGYTQPGSSPNSNPLLAGNNAKLAIVLDSSSDAQSGDPALPARASTRLPFPGYGDSENAILGIYEADNVTIRGLAFLGRHTPGSDEDPSIYAIALVKEARNARVQGNWFGLSPDGTPSEGLASAVAGFRHRVNVDGVNVDTYSEGLIAGTDSDGMNDLAEGNILCGLHIALALELPGAITAGNYFNVLPDGKTFLSVDDIHEAQLASGREAGDSSVENYENGRDTTGSVIGVRGDNINDENERNVFNLAVYDHLIEFYSSASNVVVAGNYFGVGVDGVSTPPVTTLREPNLLEGPGSGSFRLGSNNDGVADALEGNRIHKVPGASMLIAGVNVPIVARRNILTGNNFTEFLFADGANGRAYNLYYAPYVSDPDNVPPTVTTYADGKLSGTMTPPAEGYFADVDIYVADSTAPAGSVIPGRYLGTFFEGGPDDSNGNPGEFTFDLSALGVPGASMLCVAVVYSSGETSSEVGTSVTSPASNAVETGGSASEPIGNITAARSGTNLTLTWATGTPPFQVQTRATVGTGTWENVGSPVTTRTATVPIGTGAAFFRVQGQ